MVTMASDASHMLEAALEQMDDIIAGSKAAAEYTNGLFDIGAPVYLGSLQVLQLTEELRIALELLTSEGEKESLRTQISGDTAQYLKDWLETGTANLRSSVSSETYQERLARLEADKESLVLQVSVLTDQVEAQGEKIRDLESSLDEHHHKRQTTQEMLQQELLSRTYLETQKLDLIDEVSHLKLKLVGMEKEQNDCDEKQHKAEGLVQELKLLKNKVDELEGEKSQYERKLKATKAEIADLQKLLATKDAEIERLRTQLSCRTPVASDSTDREEVFRRRLKEKHQELQRLKMGMESLLAANEEKDRRINELTILLNEYRKMKDAMAVAQGSCERILSVSSEEELIGSMDTRNPVHKTNTENIRSEKSSRCSSSSLVSPSFIQNELETSCRSIHTSPEPLVSPNEDSFEDRQWAQQRMLSSSLEELQSGSLQKHIVAEPVEPVMSPENRPYVENNKYQTLPGKFSRAKHNGDNEKYKPSSVQIDNDEDEDSEFTLNRSRSASAPALGKTLKIDDATLSSSDLSPQSSGVDSGQQSPVSPENRKNPKGIKKFWGKIRRTQSGSLQAGDSGTSQFQRGGLRATAGPRLARTKETGNTKSDWNAPFSQWKMEQVCSWLEDFGLSQYVNLARQWVKTGHTLLTASPQDLEKEMGIKHPLHRKKLQLALKAFGMKQVEKSADLDHIWVTRWLDDIGLPQYKDQFNEGRVDGMMLQYLTVNDLLFLKVTSQLHHLSIKCAIHVLHVNKFNPNCLRRRPGDEHNSSPSEVVQWSNHRVMEWLRSVDLAEYAPNLRGSGVHGGLIILEPRFNSDTLAMLLNIPPQKTLLRRHLTTNFKMLIGSEAQQEKREFMESSSYAPLTTTAKVRPKKLGFSNFGHLRKKKFDDSTDYVYPMDTAQSATNGAQKGYGGHRRLSPVFGRDLHRLEQMEVTEGTVMQIGALSEGINNLTVFERDSEDSTLLFNQANLKEATLWHIKETSL
ncbi:liprin-beta-2-like isoform X9 [Acipenser ruthenus]|uniref:liprin-beta-2-like isoform X9 n=1 Tax=Acipenser ruthenus TaxID=7906 RepID=UPI00145A89CD|nr:liprin-beta-2-like isoform X9 [Acipenser ruthenus]